jgi:hypothetical protein
MLTGRRLLWSGRGWCWCRSWGGAARTTCGALLALVYELFLALEIFVEADG